jgi:hypothetical protein
MQKQEQEYRNDTSEKYNQLLNDLVGIDEDEYLVRKKHALLKK